MKSTKGIFTGIKRLDLLLFIIIYSSLFGSIFLVTSRSLLKSHEETKREYDPDHREVARDSEAARRGYAYVGEGEAVWYEKEIIVGAPNPELAKITSTIGFCFFGLGILFVLIGVFFFDYRTLFGTKSLLSSILSGGGFILYFGLIGLLPGWIISISIRGVADDYTDASYLAVLGFLCCCIPVGKWLYDVRKKKKDQPFQKLTEVGSLTDQASLTYVAKNDKDKDIRRAAVNRLTDTDALAHVAKNDKNWRVRESAVIKLTDKALLADIAWNDKEYYVRNAAEERLEDLKKK